MYWRVEGSLADLTTVRPVAFFTWNAQTFLERWVRRGLVLMMWRCCGHSSTPRTVSFGSSNGAHGPARDQSTRDRLDLLGEEYFKYKLQPF